MEKSSLPFREAVKCGAFPLSSHPITPISRPNLPDENGAGSRKEWDVWIHTGAVLAVHEHQGKTAVCREGSNSTGRRQAETHSSRPPREEMAHLEFNINSHNTNIYTY